MSGSSRNNLSSGLRVRRTYSLGAMPDGAEWTGRLVKGVRRELEAAVLEAKGRIDTFDSACINTACRWEIHGLLTLRWLRKHAETMSHDQRLSYSRDIARASESRDRAIRALGISSESQNAKSLALLYSDSLPQDAPDAGLDGQNAAEAMPESEGDGLNG